MRLFIVAIAIVGCTTATVPKFGSDACIRCYSGGAVIYEAMTNGKPRSVSTSNGYFFREKESGKLREVSGDCIIMYGGN